MPSAASRLRSWTKVRKRVRSVKSSPPNATTNVRPRNACTYGATWRSQRTNDSENSGEAICSFYKLYGVNPKCICALCFCSSEASTMRIVRALFLVSLIAGSASVRAAPNYGDEDWTAFGHVLTLVQQMIRISGHPYPDQAMADLLAGRNPEANQAMASLF